MSSSLRQGRIGTRHRCEGGQEPYAAPFPTTSSPSLSSGDCRPILLREWLQSPDANELHFDVPHMMHVNNIYVDINLLSNVQLNDERSRRRRLSADSRGIARQSRNCHRLPVVCSRNLMCA